MQPPLLLAKALPPGATIAFVSPSARLNTIFPAAVSRAKQVFTDAGYNVRVIFTPGEAGTQSCIANRLAELRSAFLDRAVSAIVCTIGGESFTELLPALVADAELHAAIRADPKVVVGYSDMTGLHWFLGAMTGLRSFYGPSAIPELGTADSAQDSASPLAFCLGNLLRAIGKPEALGDIPRALTYAPKLPPFFNDPASTAKQDLAPAPEWKWLRPGKARGRLYGGCLPVVVRLNGIRAIAPDWRGRIVFLETSIDGSEDLGAVRQGLADLIAQTVFEEAAGLVVGRAFGYDSDTARAEYEEVIKELFCEGRLGEARNQFPILFNVDFGHTTPMVTLPYGALATLDSDTDQFAVLEAGVA